MTQEVVGSETWEFFNSSTGFAEPWSLLISMIIFENQTVFKMINQSILKVSTLDMTEINQ